MPTLDNVRVVVIGDMSSALRRACVIAAQRARVYPHYIVKINSRNAVLVNTTPATYNEVFVRIGKNVTITNVDRNVQWSKEPSVIQGNWRSKVRAVIKRRLSDPGEPTSNISIPVKY